MQLLIRHARKEDYDSVNNIMKQAHELHVGWRDDIYKMTDPVLSYELFLKYLEEDTYIVAEADGMVVGILYYFIKHTDNPVKVRRNVLYVDTMAVDKKYRRRGIGTAMFDYVKKIARKNNCVSFELNVLAKNKSARKMYEDYGFSPKSYVMEMPVENCECE